MRKKCLMALLIVGLFVGLAGAYETDTAVTKSYSNGPNMQCGQAYIETLPGTSVTYSETEERTATLSVTGSISASFIAGEIGLELRSEGSVTKSLTVSATFSNGKCGYIRWGSTTRSGSVIKITWKRFPDGSSKVIKTENGSASGTRGKYVRITRS